ncbi:FAD-dependent oxidoreductase [Pigmentiphaga sp. NML080357]|uniref:FAD-dependent oxidoreductase n=1 Tax=Pigmentiphaga sp. NML080357 TaxID=2008675 RepID=UPI000B419D4C|nr:FAD-dependent oxidoreductase [Pigmentiphaga sp. NML080357]OVZ59947.1 FAD-dependent oxidoreductase [Pigmentiphaga sp. NML080357]
MANEVRTVRRTEPRPWRVDADLCVVGAGISGVSAALEAAALGRKVVLVDSLPMLGGQAVGSIIGTFCGLFSNGPNRIQLTHGIADGILKDLGDAGALHHNVGPLTTVVYYDEVALGRWIEQKIREAGITVVLGAVLREARREGRRLERLELATRYGDVHVEARGYVDASGDAALTWLAGLDCRQPDEPIFGTQMFVLENLDEAHLPTRDAFTLRIKEKAAQYGISRDDGLFFRFPGRGTAAMNMTHMETPLDPLAASATALAGREQVDRVMEFLRAEYPEAFGAARIRAYALPGIRQTRWIVGRHQLTTAEVRAGTRFPDAVARTSWPVELHDQPEGYVWEPFGEDHVHTVPLRSLIPSGSDNIVAAGRCIDADAAALSSVRVMGPCIAMGAAAAHALDLTLGSAVQDVDVSALHERIRANV